jgi:hypothetical protein
MSKYLSGFLHANRKLETNPFLFHFNPYLIGFDGLEFDLASL